MKKIRVKIDGIETEAETNTGPVHCASSGSKSLLCVITLS